MESSRRVLLVVDSLSLGGAERHVADLAVALSRAGEDPLVACSAGGPFEDVLGNQGIAVHVVADCLVKRRFCAGYATGLRRLLSAEPVDLVHAHLFASATAAAAALRGTDIPLVITEQTEAPWRRHKERRSSARAHRRAALTIAVSTRIARGLQAGEGVPAERITIIPNTVVDGDDPVRAPRNGGPPVVGVVARLQPEKGLDTFLRAAARAGASRPDVRFRIVGDGPLRASLTELAHTLGIADRVEFLGARPDGRRLLCDFDVLALPSVAEGTPLTIVEAMRAAVPIVATPAGGIPDQIRDGVDGLIVPCGDDERLAAAVLKLLDEPATAQRLAASARRRALTEFSHERMVERILAVYSRAEAAARAAEPRAVGHLSPAMATQLP